MANQKNAFLSFIRRNLFYIVLLLVMLVLTGVGVAILLNSDRGTYVSKIDSESVSQSLTDTDKDSDSSSDKPIVDDKPKVIVFGMPLENGTVTKGYTADTLVFNDTLQAYTGHMGVDVASQDGAKVLCAYDGTIESITTEYLLGTTVIVKHESGLKTVYNSIDADESLKVGQNVKKGDVLGEASDNNKQEYKDGAHLHFEVYENGKRIDPEKYLLTDGK